MCILHFHSLFSVGCQNAFQGGLPCNFLMCLLHFSCVIRHFLMCLLHFWHLQASFWSPLGPDMQLPHVFIALFMRDQAFPLVFSTVWHPPGLSWGLLFEMLVGLWSFLGIHWVQNGARHIKMRVSEAILAQVEVARGSQRHSMSRFGRDVPHLLCVVLYFGTFSSKKV